MIPSQSGGGKPEFEYWTQSVTFGVPNPNSNGAQTHKVRFNDEIYAVCCYNSDYRILSGDPVGGFFVTNAGGGGSYYPEYSTSDYTPLNISVSISEDLHTLTFTIKNGQSEYGPITLSLECFGVRRN